MGDTELASQEQQLAYEVWCKYFVRIAAVDAYYPVANTAYRRDMHAAYRELQKALMHLDKRTYNRGRCLAEAASEQQRLDALARLEHRRLNNGSDMLDMEHGTGDVVGPS